MASSRPRGNPTAAQTDSPSQSAEPQASSELDRELRKIQSLLDTGSKDEALRLAARQASVAPPFVNARAVCLLHVGKPAEAVRVFRGIALDSSGLSLRADLPLTCKINFAVALAVSGNALGAYNVLQEIGPVQDERVTALRAAIAAWQQQLSFLERLQWKLGADVDRPVRVEPLPDVLMH